MPNKSCLVIISSSKLDPLLVFDTATSQDKTLLVFDTASISYVSLQDLACISTYHLSALSLRNLFLFLFTVVPHLWPPSLLIFHSFLWSPINIANDPLLVFDTAMAQDITFIWYSELDLFIFCHTHLWPPHIFRSLSTLSLPTYILERVDCLFQDSDAWLASRCLYYFGVLPSFFPHTLVWTSLLGEKETMRLNIVSIFKLHPGINCSTSMSFFTSIQTWSRWINPTCDSQRYLWKWWDWERVRGDQMIDTITGITSYLGITSAKIFTGVCPYKDDSS